MPFLFWTSCIRPLLASVLDLVLRGGEERKTLVSRTRPRKKRREADLLDEVARTAADPSVPPSVSPGSLSIPPDVPPRVGLASSPSSPPRGASRSIHDYLDAYVYGRQGEDGTGFGSWSRDDESFIGSATSTNPCLRALGHRAQSIALDKHRLKRKKELPRGRMGDWREDAKRLKVVRNGFAPGPGARCSSVHRLVG